MLLPTLYTIVPQVFGSDMAADCAQMAERNCEALQNFTGEQGEATALDLGCSVGGTTFELRQVFPIVVGVDPDAIRIDLAKVRQAALAAFLRSQHVQP